MAEKLSKYFLAVGFKRLSLVEVAEKSSNQHEFNGTGVLKKIFGERKRSIPTKFILLSDEQDDIKEQDGVLTWYDARERHPSRSEFRLYYSPNDVVPNAKAGDFLVVALKNEEQALVVIAPQKSTSERQLIWLLGDITADDQFNIINLNDKPKDVDFAARYILSSLGIASEETAPDYLDEIISRFGRKFPATREFSEFARSTIKDVFPVDDPDGTLMAWLNREEILFKTLERELISERLKQGFGDNGVDVDDFIKYSLTVQNRRKSRAGRSFENNLEAIFVANKVKYSHGATTERNNRPDFVFPSIEEYHNPEFNAGLLTMLGLKTTAKDRWRQILAEAAKIPLKHLITLEPAISKNQTDEMKANLLQLVIPKSLQETFTTEQRTEIINVRQFIQLVQDRQSSVMY
jgi:hypothetical protein